jgi:hypothetical protein
MFALAGLSYEETPQLEVVAEYSDIQDGNIKVFQEKTFWHHPEPFERFLLTRTY